MIGRPKVPLVLTTPEQQALDSLAHRARTAPQVARRARIVLACARGLDCSAPGFLDSGLTVFASTLPRPARRGRVAPGRGFDSRISPASTVRCTSA